MFKGFLPARFVLLLCLLGAPVIRAHASDLFGGWSQRLKAPNYPALTDVTFGFGRFAAVGGSGTLITSDDAIHWTQMATGSSANLYAITFADSDVFLAVGDSQTIVISRDGVSWTQVRSNQTGTLTGVAYGAGVYVAVGASNLLVSADADNWSCVPTTNAIPKIAYGNGRFVAGPVATSAFPTLSYRMMISSNGFDWSSSQVLPISSFGAGYGFNRLQFLNGTFLLSGYIIARPPDQIPTLQPLLLSSADGDSWTAVNPSGATTLSGVASGLGRLLAVGKKSPSVDVYSTNSLFASKNGESWTALAPPTLTADFNSIVFGNNAVLPGEGVFVAVGSDSGTSSINFSQDGVNWAQAFANFSSTGTNSFGTPGFTPRAATFTSAAASPTTVVAVGTNWVATSTNGVDWTTRSVPYDLNAVSWGDFPPLTQGGVFLAAGKKIIGMSYDGYDWTWTPRLGTFYSALVTPGALLVEGDSPEGLSVSTNGTNWKTIFTDSFYTFSAYLPTSPRLLEYGNGLYVAAQLFLYGPGYNSQILTSSDAQSWRTNLTVPFSDIGSWISDVRFGNGTFIASPGLWTSANGKTWQKEAQPIPDARLGYGKGVFIAIGADGTLKYSTSGHSWTNSANPWLPFASANARPKAAAFAFNSFFIVGDGGLIVQSSPILPVPMLSARTGGSKITLILNAAPGSYHLQRTASLTSWDDLGPVTVRDESDTLIYSGEQQASQEFFKVIAQ